MSFPIPHKLLIAFFNRLTLKANRGPVAIGIIGAGGWGAANASNIMRSRRFNIVGVYDVQKNVSQQFAKRFNVKPYENVDDLLSAPAIQSVCITVPNPFHVELITKAANAGKHIFIEKPLASSPKDCRAMGEYCQKKKVLLQVGHQMRREPVFREIKQLLDTGDMGKFLDAQGTNTLNRQTREDWRKQANACPSGSMEQLGVHLIDTLIYLLGRPLKSEGWSRNIPTKSLDEPDWGCVSLHYPENTRATVSSSFSCPKQMLLELTFEKARLRTDGITLWIDREGISPKAYRPKGISGGILQFLNFAQCIEQAIAPEPGAAEAAIVMDVVQSMLKNEEKSV